MELKVCFLGAVRRRTFICCRNIQISTSSAVRDRNRSATIQTMSLTRSLIPQEHRPILDQLPVRLSFATGTTVSGETEVERTAFETIIADFLTGQFNDPVRVVAFNTLEHWSDDVSEAIATEIQT